MTDPDKALRESCEAGLLADPDLLRSLGVDVPLRHSIHHVDGHTNWVNAVAVTPDGQRLVTGSADNTAKLWDAKTGCLLQTFSGHAGDVDAVAVTPDGERLVTGSSDNTTKLWDLATGRRLHTFSGHTDAVRAAAVMPDGQRSVTGSGDHTLKFWALESGALLVTMHNVDEGFHWTTPATPSAPSGWLWTNRPDLVSVVRCNKDGGNPEPLSDGDPVRKAYLKAYNRQDMVMNRLWLSDPEIDAIENGLAARIKAVTSGKPTTTPPPQLGRGKSRRGDSSA